MRRQGPAARRRRGSGPDAARPPPPQVQARAQAQAAGAAPAPVAAAPRLPELEQRHFDVIGLGLVATAIFFAFVVYLGWDGGQAGDGAVEGLRVAARRRATTSCPAALMAAGAILVLRPVLPAVRPFRAGAICLFAALALGARRGTLGLGPGGARGLVGRRSGSSRAAAWRGRGSTAATSTLARHARRAHDRGLPVRRRGAAAHGASVAGVIKATSDSVTTTTREVAHRRASGAGPATEELLRARAGPAAARDARSRARSRSTSETLPDVLGDAEDLEPTVEDRARAARRSVPQLEEPRLAEDPETDEPGVARTDAEPEQDLTPQGRYRAAVTDVARLRVDAPRHRASSSARAPRPAGPTPPGRRRSPPS